MFLNNLENMTLSCCEIIKNHTGEIKRIVDKAKKNRKIIDIQEFRSKPICHIKRSDGDVPLNLNIIAENYVKNSPDWKKKFQSFPEGPLFYDSLFKSKPSTRAVDIQNELKELKKKVKIISKTPFDLEKDFDDKIIITKTADAINESLKGVITELNLASNKRVMDKLPNLVKGMIKGKLENLKVAAKSMETINQLQNDAFEKVLENHKTITEEKGYFKMRYIFMKSLDSLAGAAKLDRSFFAIL